jgi:hypothetical protein
MKIAIEAIVQDNLSRADAAKAAGISEDALRKSMKGNSATREFYNSELKALRQFARVRATHALIAELDGPNAAARVSAARTILEDSDRAPAGNNMAQVPGFAILIQDARASQQPIDITPLNGMAALAATAGDSK